MLQQKMSKVLGSLSIKTDSHEYYSNIPQGYQPGKTRYIIITGSVISGVGKGTFSSSIGTLFKLKHGFNVQPVKFDGYLNYDAGTLNPFRHGEVFVLDDGTETDLDLGSYERMINENFTKDNYLTSGKVFKIIIDKERKGEYLGRDVQVIPHLTGEIKYFMRNLAAKTSADIVLIEVGGTIGDLENAFFLEAMRELAYEEGKDHVCFVNVAYIMQPRSLGEQKSKAAQLGIKALMGMGIQPDIIILRAENKIDLKVREKISIYSNVPIKRVVGANDVKNFYEIPLIFDKQGIDNEIMGILNLRKNNGNNMSEYQKWKELVCLMNKSDKKITVAIAGKYTKVHDSYLSILKTLEHTAPYMGAKVDVKWIETTDVSDVSKYMKGIDGVIVPGGFGKRGTSGKIECIRHARENNIPFLGLCYGMQMAMLEFARNVCGIKNANSTEIDQKTTDPVICILPEQEEIEGLGGTMRLGGYDILIKPGTIAHKIYGSEKARERFRHRYNVNPKYIEILESKGLVFSGMAPQKKIMQIAELQNHKFFVGTQFHPEFSSKPLNPHPLFKGFIEACLKR